MFNQKLYRNAMEELRAPQDKIEEVIKMTQDQTKKKHRRPLRAAAVAAAAAALLTVGVSAANPDGMQRFLYHISSIVQLDQFRSEITTQDGDQFSLLDASNVSVKTREERVILAAGSEEVDITDALEQEGGYTYEKVSDASQLKVEVTGTPQSYQYSVTLGTADEENPPVFSFRSDSPNDVTIGGGSGVTYQWESETSGEGEGRREGIYIAADSPQS